MTLPSFMRSSAQFDLYICARCAFRVSGRSATPARRWNGSKSAANVEASEKERNTTAHGIRQGKKKSVLSILDERGLVHSVTGSRNEVDRMLTDNRLGVYVGIDPTAPSLHIGHMLPLMSLFWMYINGHHVVTLVGGATAKIGDPTDRLTTRQNIHEYTRNENTSRIHEQLEKLWHNVEAYSLKYGYKMDDAGKRRLVNNDAWMDKLSIMEVLQLLGPGVRIGTMLAKETVKNKMNKGDGMSFAEFTYPLLQAWDWWHMYKTMGVCMQIGGSDQYGNITAGVDAVKYIATNHPAPEIIKEKTGHPFGFTVPLLTTSSGAKFGKSAGNAIWLDHEMTSTFDQYGYFLRASDDDVARYLKLFTFMPVEDIDALLKEHMENPSLRKAQHKLASEFLELVHGESEAASVKTQHELLFQKAPKSSSSKVNQTGVSNPTSLPHVFLKDRPKAQLQLPRTFIESKSIGKILYACGLAGSASEGHRLAKERSIHLGGFIDGNGAPIGAKVLSFTPIQAWRPEDAQEYLVDDTLLILRRGKHNVRIIEVIDDQKYENSGLSYPGREVESV